MHEELNEDQDEDQDIEIPLIGGNVSESVVRVGNTVRKPVTASTPAVEVLLKHLDEVGFESAPKPLGQDERGRQVLEFIPGTMADAYGQPPLSIAGLQRVGRLIRELHDATASFVPPTDAAWNVAIPSGTTDLICHRDLAPWNLVFADDGRWVFIDWDGAGPGSRLWDLAYAALGFVPLNASGDPAVDAPRLRAFANGYGLDEQQRRALPELIVGHTRGMYDLLRRGFEAGEQPWARLYAEGHGDHWGPAADYIEANLEVWRRALLT